SEWLASRRRPERASIPSNSAWRSLARAGVPMRALAALYCLYMAAASCWCRFTRSAACADIAAMAKASGESTARDRTRLLDCIDGVLDRQGFRRSSRKRRAGARHPSTLFHGSGSVQAAVAAVSGYMNVTQFTLFACNRFQIFWNRLRPGTPKPNSEHPGLEARGLGHHVAVPRRIEHQLDIGIGDSGDHL